MSASQRRQRSGNGWPEQARSALSNAFKRPDGDGGNIEHGALLQTTCSRREGCFVRPVAEAGALGVRSRG